MFIRVIEIQYQDEILINISQISYIHKPSGTIIITGVTGEQNGVIHITQESMFKLINIIYKKNLVEEVSNE